jgi:hypothetical protein
MTRRAVVSLVVGMTAMTLRRASNLYEVLLDGLRHAFVISKGRAVAADPQT